MSVVKLTPILAGTGHRPDKLGGYSLAAHKRLVAVARDAIVELRPARIISGMALGWDQALAVAAVQEGVPFDAAVPFQGQESSWPMLSQTQYRKLLKQAASVTIVCEGRYEHWMMQARNEWMIDRCHAVLALFDGSPGGTANCIRYAKEKGKTIHNRIEHYNALEIDSDGHAQVH